MIQYYLTFGRYEISVRENQNKGHYMKGICKMKKQLSNKIYKYRVGLNGNDLR